MQEFFVNRILAPNRYKENQIRLALIGYYKAAEDEFQLSYGQIRSAQQLRRVLLEVVHSNWLAKENNRRTSSMPSSCNLRIEVWKSIIQNCTKVIITLFLEIRHCQRLYYI